MRRPTPPPSGWTPSPSSRDSGRRGKLRRLGFSYHDKAELLDQILTDHPDVEFVQLQLNYLGLGG